MRAYLQKNLDLHLLLLVRGVLVRTPHTSLSRSAIDHGIDTESSKQQDCPDRVSLFYHCCTERMVRDGEGNILKAVEVGRLKLEGVDLRRDLYCFVSLWTRVGALLRRFAHSIYSMLSLSFVFSRRLTQSPMKSAALFKPGKFRADQFWLFCCCKVCEGLTCLNFLQLKLLQTKWER